MFKFEIPLKKLLLLPTLFFCVYIAAADEHYRFTADLTNVKRDKIKVTLTVPSVQSDKVIYVMPAAVPGTYAVKKYGRFITKFKAFDKDNNALPCKIIEDRDFIIEKANTLHHLEYWVNDTWDDKNSRNAVFQAAGSNIEDGKNFVINHFAVCGFFEGLKDLPYEITYKKPAEFYGSTSLQRKESGDTSVTFVANGYDQLADGPVMFCKPDTASFIRGETSIYISSYAASGKTYAAEIKNNLEKLMNGLTRYLGNLPVNKYHFIFYFSHSDEKIINTGSGLSGHGAMEHHNSSLYFLSEPQNENDLSNTLPFICSHEFLHTLTPLTLRSSVVDEFQYRFPVFSKHLWLYEGVTEYFSLQALLKSGMISEEDFLQIMSEKIETAAFYPLFSITEMSENVSGEYQQRLYPDVYSKGALLAWLLDVQITDHSTGNSSLLKVIQQLMEKYRTNGFKEEELIPEFISITDPALQQFFDDYVTGHKSLVYKEQLKATGYLFMNDEFYDIYKSGPVELQLAANRDEVKLINANSNIGFLPGDVLKQINGIPVTRSNVHRLFSRYFIQNISPDEIEITVKRMDAELNLTYKPQLKHELVYNLIVPDKNAGEKQLIVRKVISGQ